MAKTANYAIELFGKIKSNGDIHLYKTTLPMPSDLVFNIDTLKASKRNFNVENSRFIIMKFLYNNMASSYILDGGFESISNDVNYTLTIHTNDYQGVKFNENVWFETFKKITGKSDHVIPNIIKSHEFNFLIQGNIEEVMNLRETLTNAIPTKYSDHEVFLHVSKSVDLQASLATDDLINYVEKEYGNFQLDNGVASLSKTTWIGNYYTPPYVAITLAPIEHMLERNKIVRIVATGESGTGKSTLADILGEISGFDVVKINCSAITDPEAWFIERGAENGTTYDTKTEFYEALLDGNKVILLDEINRVAPDISNALLSILDYRKEFQIKGHTHKLADNLIFVMTANIGYQYSGTFPLDSALGNRKDMVIKFKELPGKVLIELAERKYGIPKNEGKELYHRFKELRDYIYGNENTSYSIDMTTRAFENVCNYYVASGDMRNAFVYSVLNEIIGDMDLGLQNIVSGWL